MSNQFKSPEECLLWLVAELNKAGKHYPCTVGELMLPGLCSYEDLRAKIANGTVVIYRSLFQASDDTIVRIVAPHFWIYTLFCYLIILGVPILGVVLSVTVSWWFLIFLVACPVGWKMLRNGYSRSVIHAALRSEIEFCSLFNAGVVRLMTAAGDRITPLG